MLLNIGEEIIGQKIKFDFDLRPSNGMVVMS